MYTYTIYIYSRNTQLSKVTAYVFSEFFCKKMSQRTKIAATPKYVSTRVSLSIFQSTKCQYSN